MTQKFIRKLAGWGPLKRAIAQLHEPRIVSAIYGAAYVVATIVGAISITSPPRTIEHAAGDLLMTIIATAITLGGALGIVTVAAGNYWVERYAAALMLLGGTGYLLMVLYLQAITTDGNRLFQAGAIFTAGLFFAVRYYWVGDRPYNPRRPRARPEA